MYIFLLFKCSFPFNMYWSVSSTTIQEPLSADFIVMSWLFDNSLSVIFSVLERLRLAWLDLRWEVLRCMVEK